ncbi:MAG TPA: hypothetical protein PKD17_03465 [Cellvibrionaceae bacterium]|nr:hypothetical protein [Cellvibrionaceae bacterium]HMW70849.1 hypothetical protein [Cellvibrionaceae bacterium]HNG58484.1 hypothetical protein [Cellvibrionaceae bacterium]
MLRRLKLEHTSLFNSVAVTQATLIGLATATTTGAAIILGEKASRYKNERGENAGTYDNFLPHIHTFTVYH